MDQIEKFLRKLEKQLALKLIFVLQDIVALKLADYDTSKMKGLPDHFRVRIGKIRIIFIKSAGKGVPIYIEYRGKGL